MLNSRYGWFAPLFLLAKPFGFKPCFLWQVVVECLREKTKLLNYAVRFVPDARRVEEKLEEDRKINSELAERLEFV